MTTAAELLAAADDLARRTDALPKVIMGALGEMLSNHHAHRTAAADLAQRLRDEYGARISDRPAEGVRMTMLGVTTTCTGGMAGAFRNWINAARRKAGAL